MVLHLQGSAGTAQASGNVHADLLGLDSDPLLQWWDAAAPQGTNHQSSGPLPSGLPAIFAPGGGEEQFSAGGTALRSAPPGIELTTATAVGNLGGRRPEVPFRQGNVRMLETDREEMLTSFKFQTWKRCSQVS